MRLVGQDTIKNKIWEYYKKNKQKKLAQKKTLFFRYFTFFEFLSTDEIKNNKPVTSFMLFMMPTKFEG